MGTSPERPNFQSDDCPRRLLAISVASARSAALTATTEAASRSYSLPSALLAPILSRRASPYKFDPARRRFPAPAALEFFTSPSHPSREWATPVNQSISAEA